MTPEALAQLFHETYERLAPAFGYRTRRGSSVPWADVPAKNRALMIATCSTILDALGAHRCGLPSSIVEALNSGDGTYRP